MPVEGADQSKYPAEQRRDADPGRVEATAFREREAPAKVDRGVRPVGYGTQPKECR